MFCLKLSYPPGNLVHMALNLPPRFILRTVPEFVDGLNRVHANFWHWEAKGDLDFERPAGLMAQGSRDAMLWLSGQSPFPPGYLGPLARSRANVLKLLRFAEMILTGEGELADQEDANVSIMDTYAHAGARAVYAWALLMTEDAPGDDLLPEDIRAAQRRMAMVNHQTRNVA